MVLQPEDFWKRLNGAQDGSMLSRSGLGKDTSPDQETRTAQGPTPGHTRLLGPGGTWGLVLQCVTLRPHAARPWSGCYLELAMSPVLGGMGQVPSYD